MSSYVNVLEVRVKNKLPFHYPVINGVILQTYDELTQFQSYPIQFFRNYLDTGTEVESKISQVYFR